MSVTSKRIQRLEKEAILRAKVGCQYITTTDPYYFVPGPVVTINNSSSLMYMPIQCAISAQRLFLSVFDMKKKTYKQSQWILHSGHLAYLFYDPHRQHLFGLCDVSKVTLIIEEYNMTTLDVIRQKKENNATHGIATMGIGTT
jgi:hypothetical protein